VGTDNRVIPPSSKELHALADQEDAEETKMRKEKAPPINS